MSRYQAKIGAVLDEELDELRDATASNTIELDDDETRRLAEILDRGFDPPPALLECLRRLSDPERTAPSLSWTDAPA